MYDKSSIYGILLIPSSFIPDVIYIPSEFVEKVKLNPAPLLLIINKIDLINQEKLEVLVEKWKSLLPRAEIYPVSALEKFNIDTVQRLNTDKRGTFLGSFGPDDKILTITQNGNYKLTGFDLTTHFEEDMVLIEKFNPSKPISAVYYDGETKTYFVKRFLIEPTDKKVLFISEAEGSRLEIVTTEGMPVVELKFSKVKDKELPDEMINLVDFIAVKGMKAKGNKLSFSKVKEINLLPPVEIPIDEDVVEEFEESGMSPIEALKKTQEPVKEKSVISIDQMINAEIKLPSEEKKKKKKKDDDGEAQITLDL